ncbi:efflux RND transporter permease subunit [Candidatus Fermentibacteria bacterium]|nr:efflux RND transporter permease subunit [Candidatus Fermentibacteria bacterium]
MSLPGLAARRRVAFLMVYVLMAGAGAFGAARLGLDYLPKVDLGVISIVTALPGAGPEEVETLVSEELEKAVGGIEDVSSVESESRASLSLVTIELGSGADIDKALEDVKEAVNQLQPTLPGNATDPYVFAMESSMKPLVVASFSSSAMGSPELRRLVDDEIQPVLSRVPGVASVVVSGGEVRQVNVLVDPVLTWERSIPLSQVYGALAAAGADMPGGQIDDDGIEVPLSMASGFHSLGEIRSLVVGMHGGVPVRLADIAAVEEGFEEKTNISTLDGVNTVILVIRKSADANSVTTCDRITEELDRISREYAGMLDMDIVYNQRDFVRSSSDSLVQSGILAMFLAAAVLVLFLGSPVNAGIVSISMPLSFVTTFFAMYALGVNLNILSLAGLSISIGMILDNSVVVLENIHRRRRGGEGVLEAAEKGAGQVAGAVAASSLTTVAVFIPMLFVRGLTGQIFRDLSLTIISALFISLFVSLSLIPLLAGMSGRLVKTHRKGSPLLAVQNGIGRLETAYTRALNWCVTHRRRTVLSTLSVFVVSAVIMKLLPTSLLPDLKEGAITITASAPPGTSLGTTDSIAAALEDSITAVFEPGDLLHCRMEAGRSSGLAAAFGSDASNRLELTLYLDRESRLEVPPGEYMDRCRAVLDEVPGLSYTIFDGTPIGTGDPVMIAVYGRDLDSLRAMGDRLVGALSGIRGTVDHASSLDEWVDQVEFVPDPAVLSQRGRSPAAIASEVTIGVMGLDASTFYESGRTMDVHLSFPERSVSTVERVMGLPVFGAPLESWGSFEFRRVPQMIWHRDRSRAVLVTCGIEGRPLGDVGRDIQAMMDTMDLGNARWELLGDIPEQKESFASMTVAILVAAVLVFMVMAAQFESLLEPFLLIFSIPMGLIGVAAVHLVTGATIGLTSLIGILMLAGIVVNNGIVLVDFANQLRRLEGMPPQAAVVEAGRRRMRPILMTATTTVLALLPLALSTGGNSNLWAPMATTVIGGMIAATPLTLLVLPTMYAGMMGRKKGGE